MKQLIHPSLLMVLCFICFNSKAQNVGIGTTTPLARLHVTDSNVIFSAPYSNGSFPFNLPINGAGTRMMWLPAIGAFRVGAVSGNYWNRDSIGLYSFAAGSDTRALGLGATAMGGETVALASWSTAIGLRDTASAFETVAMGTNNKASGFGATAFGSNTVASGLYASSMGFGTKASGDYSLATGNITIASGLNAIAIGYNTSASGDYSIATGNFTKATGVESTAMGYFTNASGVTSTALGYNTNASGSGSTAMGFKTTASGGNSTAIGENTIASGLMSTATGESTTAIGDFSTASGYFTKSTGDYSTAMGNNTIAKAYASLAIGTYNDSIAGSNPNFSILTDPLVTFGNGTSSLNRTNAMVIYKNGNTDINGFTRLGKSTDAAPYIKMKTITTTGPIADGSIAIPHGLDATKILSVSVLMEFGSGAAETIPPFYTINPGYEYQYQVRTADIFISNKSGNSSNLGSRPVKILITYKL